MPPPKLIISWIKKNLNYIILVFILLLVLLLCVFGWWVKIRGFKISNLLTKLQIATTQNDINHLEVKKAVLDNKENTNKKEIEQIEKEIKELKKNKIRTESKIKGLSDEEIANRFTELGF